MVEVRFDPKVISYEELVRKALKADCAAPVFTRTDEQHRIAVKIAGDLAERARGEVRPDKDPKYYLSRTNLKYLPMTPLQAARVNALIRSPEHRAFLSPGQIDLLEFIEAHPDAGWTCAIGKDLAAAWKEAEALREKVSAK